MRVFWQVGIVVVAGVGAVSWAGGSAGLSRGAWAIAPPAVVHEVAIRDFAYAPPRLSIRVGDTVRWTNFDAAPHDAAAEAGGWMTPLLKQGESAVQVFDKPGVHPYYCTLHPAMRGTLEVK